MAELKHLIGFYCFGVPGFSKRTRILITVIYHQCLKHLVVKKNKNKKGMKKKRMKSTDIVTIFEFRTLQWSIRSMTETSR